MQRLPFSIASGTLVPLLLGACGVSDAGGEARNVLLIVVDTLRADHVGAYGYAGETTPRIDALAREGLVFERAYAQSSWTKPSIASIFTSLPASQHRVLEESVANRLGDDLSTLAELLGQAGLRTAAFVENPHVVSATGFDQGFERFEGPLDWSHDDWVADCDVTAQRAIAWMDECGSEPWFTYVHLLDPHDPYDQGDFAQVEAADWSESVAQGKVIDLLDPSTDLPRRSLDPEELRQLVALYDDEVRHVDAAVGRILDALDRMGRREDTLVVLTSDHGEEFLEHGRLRHGYHLYEETVRVPLIVSVPGRGPERFPERPVRHVDLAPGILGSLGLDVPEAFTGKHFLAHHETPGTGLEPVVCETAMRGLWRRSLRLGRWKLLRDELRDTSELYDLEKDPAEERDLGELEPEVLRDLETLLGELRRPRALSSSPGELEPEVLEALERLGYSGGKVFPH